MCRLCFDFSSCIIENYHDCEKTEDHSTVFLKKQTLTKLINDQTKRKFCKTFHTYVKIMFRKCVRAWAKRDESACFSIDPE